MGVLDKLKNKIIKNDNPKIEKVSTDKLILKDECVTTPTKNVYYQPISISLRYVAVEKYPSYTGEIKVGTRLYKTQNFIVPRGMSIDDACLVLSYLTEKFEKEYNYEPASQESVARLAYNLPKYGFAREFDVDENVLYHQTQSARGFAKANKNNKKNKNTDIKLYTVGGDFNLFKKTDMYNEYFNWFTPNVTEAQVNAIYAKAGKELPTSSQAEPNC